MKEGRIGKNILKRSFDLGKVFLKIASEYTGGLSKFLVNVFKRVKNICVANKRLILKVSVRAFVPLAAVGIMIGVVRRYDGVNVGLKLDCGGDKIAVVEDEKVVEEANRLVNSKFATGDVKRNETVPLPKYELVEENTGTFEPEEVVCEKILDQSKGVSEESVGVYVNGSFLGAVSESYAVIEEFFNGLRESYRTSDSQLIEFVQNVEFKTGLHSVESVMTFDDFKELISAPVEKEEYYCVKDGDTPVGISESFGITVEELQSFNQESLDSLMFEGKQVRVKLPKPLLDVKIIVEEASEREIDFETVETKDDNEYREFSKVTQEGEKGLESCVERVVYVDGKEVARELLSSEVLKAPVNKNVIVGTKEKANSKTSEGTGVSSGSLMAPLSNGISSYFGEARWGGRTHTGVDFMGSIGEGISAADGGIVSGLGYSDGYGRYVEIDHSSGLRTLYAHLGCFKVSSGQKVSKGQIIGTVGMTGITTGPHCHFEVIVGGVQRNPLNYLR